MPKIAKMGTPSLAASPRKTRGKRRTKESALTAPAQKTPLFNLELPAKLEPPEAVLLVFLYSMSGSPPAQLPYNDARMLEKLRLRKLIRCKGYPTRYFLTRQGFSLAALLIRLVEHAETDKA